MLTVEEILREDFDWEDIVIDEDEYEELESGLIIDYLKKNSPEARQKLLMCWNFDNSLKVIKWIAEQPDTDKGTALFLYWYMEPSFQKKFANREECEKESSWYLETYDMLATLEKNYTSGFYKNQIYAFNPQKDIYNSNTNWTIGLKKANMKREIPQEMFVALEGEVVDNPYWGEGIPDEIAPILDRLCDIVEE